MTELFPHRNRIHLWLLLNIVRVNLWWIGEWSALVSVRLGVGEIYVRCWGAFWDCLPGMHPFRDHVRAREEGVAHGPKLLLRRGKCLHHPSERGKANCPPITYTSIGSTYQSPTPASAAPTSHLHLHRQHLWITSLALWPQPSQAKSMSTLVSTHTQTNSNGPMVLTLEYGHS